MKREDSEKDQMQKAIVQGILLLLGYVLSILFLLSAVLFRILRFLDPTLNIPKWLDILVCVVGFVGIAFLAFFRSTVTPRRRNLRKLRKQLEKEQSCKPIETPTLAEYFDTYKEQTKQVLDKEKIEKKKMTAIEREASEQWDAANEESTTQWW